MTVRLDPVLFRACTWNTKDANSMSKFKIFSGFLFGNLRHHPNEVVKGELDAFIALLQDPLLLSQVSQQVERLRNEL